MKKIGIVAVLSIIGMAGVFSAGCGSSGTGCDFKSAGIHICETYDSAYPSDTVNSLCTAESGTAGSCPTANALGTCSITSGTYKNSETFYSDSSPAITADQAKTSCTSEGGTWTAGS